MNPHALAGTSPSSWRVCQFRHSDVARVTPDRRSIYRPVPRSRLAEWASSRRVHEDETLSTGFVSRVVPLDQVVDAALEIGAKIAELAPMAVAMTKETRWANLHASSLDHALSMESRTQVMTRNTGDAIESRRAFLEKRTPEFGTPDTPRPAR